MATKILYNGALISTLNPGYSATLECAGHEMDGNVVVEVAPEQGGGPTKPAGDPYITFSSPSAFTIQATRYVEDMFGGGFGPDSWGSMVDTPEKNWDGIIEYSTDTTTWTEWDGVTEISSVDGKLYLRGTGNTRITGNADGAGWGTYRFKITGENVSCSGNLENLLDYITTSSGQHPEIVGDAFYGMFYECDALVSAPDILAESFNRDNCSYVCSNMFYYCTNLVTPPRLAATTLCDYCYEFMFEGCTNLASVPELPAISLPDGCYNYMFTDCPLISISTEQTEECTNEFRIPSSGIGELAPYDPENAEYFSFAEGMFGWETEIEIAIDTTYYLNVPVHSATPPAEEGSGSGVAGSITTANITLVLEPGDGGFNNLEFSSAIYTKYENGIVSVGRIDIPYEEASITETTTYELKNVVTGSFMYIYAWAPNSLEWEIEPLYSIDHLAEEIFWQVNGTGDITFTIRPYDMLGGGGVEP